MKYLLCILVLGASLSNRSMAILDWVCLSYCTMLVVVLAAKLSSRLNRYNRYRSSLTHRAPTFKLDWGVHILVSNIAVAKPNMSHCRYPNFSQILRNTQGKIYNISSTVLVEV
jgi:hypothetical protein